MDKHIKAVGILHIVIGFLGMIGAGILFMVLAGSGVLSHQGDVALVTMVIATFIGGFLAVLSIPEVIGGYFLLKRKEWARILVLVLGFLDLLHFPLGTFLGVYTIWALLDSRSKPLFVG